MDHIHTRKHYRKRHSQVFEGTQRHMNNIIKNGVMLLRWEKVNNATTGRQYGFTRGFQNHNETGLAFRTLLKTLTFSWILVLEVVILATKSILEVKNSCIQSSLSSNIKRTLYMMFQNLW